MRKLLLHFVLILSLSALPVLVYSQTQDSLRLSSLKTKLDGMIQTDSLYGERMDISVSNMEIHAFLQNIAKASGLNINVSLQEGKRITCNFKQARITDILFFICKEHQLDVTAVGNILSVYSYQAPIPEPPVTISYQPADRTISFDFTAAQLIRVVKKISEASGVNIIVPQKLFEERIAAYGNAMMIDDAISSIAATNGLMAQKKNETTWTLFREDAPGEAAPAQRNLFRMDELTVDSLGLITAKINQANIRHILPDVCQRLNLNYFFTDDLDHSTSISVNKVRLASFLKVLFTGTNFTWRQENGIFIFGKKEGNSLSTAQVLPMKYRTVDKVTEYIPAELKQGMEIITFPELNSLVISGDQRGVMQIIAFLNDIDRSVPLISIDVIIVDASDTNTREAGISMGKGTEPTITTGTLSPGVDLTLGAGTINRLINSFNGFGSINLGKVSPNFYMGLKLLEENGKIMLRSTPRLSTLNGHKATLKSGEMKYYKESQTNIIGTQNPLQSESYLWKNVEANLTLDITPYVSLDSCITMQVDLVQSEFTERETQEAPPGTTTRSFNSIIKVRNQEMVLLGGIERNLSSRTSTGLPLIARIPILRSIFGTTSKKKSIQKLNVFIKPTIIE